jgi:hypothetical protein
MRWRPERLQTLLPNPPIFHSSPQRNHSPSASVVQSSTLPLLHSTPSSQPSSSSGTYSSRSPGWQSSSRQMASSVEKRIARALFVFRIDRLASVMSTASASSVRLIPRLTSSRSRFTRIAMAASNRERLLALEL